MSDNLKTYIHPMQYSVVLVLSQLPAPCITLIEISLDGGFVSASVETEGLMGDLRNLLM
jgi:hypothetical protein